MDDKIKISILGCWGVGTVGETTSFLIDFPNISIMIDTGLSPAKQLKQLNRVLPEISYIAITHVHADHLQGLPYALFARNIQERTYGPVAPMKIISHEEGIQTAQELCKLVYPDRPLSAEWIKLKSGDCFELGTNVTLKTLSVQHTVPCFAYRLDSGKKSVTISGDTLPTQELISFANKSTLLIHESFGTEKDFSVPAHNLKHSLSIDASRMANDAGVSNLMLFHMHERYVVNEKKQEMLAEAKKIFKGNVIFPADLDQYEF